MRQLLFTSSLLIALSTSTVQAQGLSENFNGAALPANWILINDHNTPDLDPSLNAALTTNAWVLYEDVPGSGDNMMISTSLFNPAGMADRWLISPSFMVTSANMILKWDDFNFGSPEKLQILVSPTAGTTAAAFTQTVYNRQAGFNEQNTHFIPLGSYNGQTIRIAFRENNTDIYAMGIDNVSTPILPNAEAALTKLEPGNGSPTYYGLPNSVKKIGGTIVNNGLNPITSYVVKYKQGNNAPVSQTFTASPALQTYESASFQFTTGYTIPAVGDYPATVWVELPNDNLHTNDTLKTMFTGVSSMPTKRLLVEEGTGTWCQYCVSGIVYMDSINKMHPDVNLVAVHNRDPMADAAYDRFLTTRPGFQGFPSVFIDRREIRDPEELFDIYGEQKDYFGFADISLAPVNILGNALSLTATVKPAIALNGDYRLVLAITEDRVHGTTAGYNQTNYYSGGNIPLANSEYDFVALPNPVPAAIMYYDFVGRKTVPSPEGAANLPAAMALNGTYDYTFATTLDPSWVRNKLHAVVMLVRGSDGQVLNSNKTQIALGIDETAANSGLDKVVVYPNPASGLTTLKFDMNEAAMVGVTITDVMGRTVYTIPEEKRTAGVHQLQFNVNNFATGIYNVKVQTGTGYVTRRMTVSK